jgi:hypothetical protein
MKRKTQKCGDNTIFIGPFYRGGLPGSDTSQSGYYGVPVAPCPEVSILSVWFSGAEKSGHFLGVSSLTESCRTIFVTKLGSMLCYAMIPKRLSVLFDTPDINIDPILLIYKTTP